ncbi:hypothetical protein AB0H83_21710 [Dactylosporangium sp. NPDC050688]
MVTGAVQHRGSCRRVLVVEEVADDNRQLIAEDETFREPPQWRESRLEGP